MPYVQVGIIAARDEDGNFLFQPIYIQESDKALPPQYGALNVREEPNGKIIGTLKNGQPVKVLDTVQHNGESWAKIGEKKFVNMVFLKTE